MGIIFSSFDNEVSRLALVQSSTKKQGVFVYRMIGMVVLALQRYTYIRTYYGPYEKVATCNGITAVADLHNASSM